MTGHELLSILSFAILLIHLNAAFGAENYEDWNYHDQHAWKEKFHRCKGQKQSPINIDTDNVLLDESLAINYTNYQQKLNFNMSSDGHTIKLELMRHHMLRSDMPFIYLGSLKYNFLGVHFHWSHKDKDGSEHAVDGHRSAMEIHLVHANDLYWDELARAQYEHDGLAVLAVLLEAQRKNSPYLEPIAERLTLVNGTNASTPISLALDDLLPDSVSTFYRYQGSLTTPGCMEVVTWTVFADKMQVGHRQLETFRTLAGYSREGFHPLTGNVRGIQPVGPHRKIYISAACLTTPPQLVTFALCFLVWFAISRIYSSNK